MYVVVMGASCCKVFNSLAFAWIREFLEKKQRLNARGFARKFV